VSRSALNSVLLRWFTPLPLTERHEKLKEDMQGIVDQTVNSANEQRNRLDTHGREIDDLRKTLQAQSAQLTQPPTRLPQAAVQAHEKRADDRGSQHPKPQAQRKLQLPPDSKESSTQSRLQVCNSLSSRLSPVLNLYLDSLKRRILQ
jgi:hypothetical protein